MNRLSELPPLIASVPSSAMAPTQAMISEAAQWYVQLHAEDVNDGDRIAFERWKAESSQHARAYAEISALWQRFDAVQDSAATNTVKEVLRDRKGDARRRVATTLSLILLLAATLGVAKSPVGDYLLADYRTGIGQQKTIELADQTRITLNTASAVDIEYTHDQRRIVLRRGEVLVNVARDASRPFIVETQHGTARALGTVYTVRQESEKSTVSVIESLVQACTQKRTQCADLAASKRAIIGPEGIEVDTMQAAAIAAWTRNNLIVDNRPLSEVLRELSRYRKGHISFDEETLGHIHVSGVFPLDDTDRALSVLVATTPIRVRHFTPYWVTVSSD